MLILCMIFLALVSCKCHEHCSAVVQNGSELFSIVRSVDTVVVRDSVFVSERQRGDTVYLTRTEWRDRWRTRVVHDTVQHTKYVDRVVEKPPERYIPKFHKWCTGLLWVLVAAAVLCVALKIYWRK